MSWMDEIAELTAAMPGAGPGGNEPLSGDECLRACFIAVEFNRMAANPEQQALITPEEKQRQAEDFNWLINNALLRAMGELLALRRREQEGA